MNLRRAVLFVALVGAVVVNALMLASSAEAQPDDWTCAYSGEYAFCGQYIVNDCARENCSN